MHTYIYTHADIYTSIQITVHAYTYTNISAQPAKQGKGVLDNWPKKLRRPKFSSSRALLP